MKDPFPWVVRHIGFLLVPRDECSGLRQQNRCDTMRCPAIAAMSVTKLVGDIDDESNREKMRC